MAEEIRPEAFNAVLHSAPRITIMSRLVIHRALRFGALQKSTTLTPGNLSGHLRVLEDAGYIAMDSMPNAVTRRRNVKITSSGEAEFRSYVNRMRAIFGDLLPGPAVGPAERPEG